MKFIAVIDYDLIDKEFNTVCIRDKEGNLHDIDAKPLITHMIVTEEGESLYLTQGHIDAMLKYEELVGIKKAIDNIMGKTEE